MSDKLTDAIFDTFAASVGVMARHDNIVELQGRIKDMEREVCGHCDLWMKSTCKPEKQGGSVKSMNSVACSAFTLDSWSLKFTNELKAELQGVITMESEAPDAE